MCGPIWGTPAASAAAPDVTPDPPAATLPGVPAAAEFGMGAATFACIASPLGASGASLDVEPAVDVPAECGRVARKPITPARARNSRTGTTSFFMGLLLSFWALDEGRAGIRSLGGQSRSGGFLVPAVVVARAALTAIL